MIKKSLLIALTLVLVVSCVEAAHNEKRTKTPTTFLSMVGEGNHKLAQ
jgi:hypothetical protein